MSTYNQMSAAEGVVFTGKFTTTHPTFLFVKYSVYGVLVGQRKVNDLLVWF